jgi:hypothetical protein
MSEHISLSTHQAISLLFPFESLYVGAAICSASVLLGHGKVVRR